MAIRLKSGRRSTRLTRRSVRSAMERYFEATPLKKATPKKQAVKKKAAKKVARRK